MQRKFGHLISQYNLIYPPTYSSFTSLSSSLQPSQEFSLNKGIPSVNKIIIDSTTTPSHFSIPPILYIPRFYNPLQHQQGIRSYSQLHQYCQLNSGISSNDSTSSISSDDHSFISSSFLSNTSTSFSDSETMLCLVAAKYTLNASKPSFTTNNHKVNWYRLSYLTSSHLQQLLKYSSYDFIHKQSSISTNLIKAPTISCTSLNDDPNIPPVDHLLDHPIILQISQSTSTFGDNLLPKQNNITRILYQNSGSLGISNNYHDLEVIYYCLLQLKYTSNIWIYWFVT